MKKKGGGPGKNHLQVQKRAVKIEKLRKHRKELNKIMDRKMRLNVEDHTDPSLKSKKFWKQVKF